MRPDESQAKRQFSLGNLFTDLTRELSTLVRQEAQLIKAEVAEKASDAKAGAGEMPAGGAILLVGFLILMLAAVAGPNEMLGVTGKILQQVPVGVADMVGHDLDDVIGAALAQQFIEALPPAHEIGVGHGMEHLIEVDQAVNSGQVVAEGGRPGAVGGKIR